VLTCSCRQVVQTQTRFNSFRAIRTRSHGLALLTRTSNRVWAEEHVETVDLKNEGRTLCQADGASLEKDLVADSSANVVEPGSEGNDSRCFQSLEFPSEKIRIGVKIFQRSALLSGSMLDEAVANVFNAVNHSSSSSVLFTSKPLAAMASKPIFKLFFVLMSAFTCYSCGIASKALLEDGNFTPSHVRLQILSTREVNPSGQQKPAISAFGLLQDGCPVAISYVGINNTWTISQSELFPGAKKINGYFFKPSTNISGPEDPTSWRVESTFDNGSSWVMVGSSVWRLNPAGTPEFYPGIHNSQRAGGSEMEINVWGIGGDMRPPLSWMLNTIGEYATFSLGFAGMAATSLRGRVQYTLGFWVSMLFVDALLYLAANAVILRKEQWLWREAVESWMDIGAQLLLGILTLLDEKRFIRILIMCCALNTISNTASDIVLYGRDWVDVLYARLSTLSGIGFFFGIGVLLFRQQALAQAHALVLDHKRKYDSIWDSIIANPDSKAAIFSICDASISLSNKQDACSVAPRQRMQKTKSRLSVVYNWASQRSLPRHSQSWKMPTFGGLWRVSSATRPGSRQELVKVTSLDQLFFQAWCLSPILLKKTKSWALQCKGCFPFQASDTDSITYQVYKEEMEAMGSQIKWAKVKSFHRAIEKAVRAYHQDVSSIVDLCRQCIVFEDLKDIAACLRVIEADCEVRVLRVKNRLDLKHRSSISAGYRDVGMNLQIVSAETRTAGIDSHICELQLIYKPVAELKSEEGHSGYVAFRNIRGE